ncbi:hypothetical protein GQ44DRAFT_711370 [Phaeosphaeriaceae sp. PMI808]|nr:hypothetical protein GQ44DRAFT_711370 [Phaeosphaeriaceae sp. PMI808]
MLNSANHTVCWSGRKTCDESVAAAKTRPRAGPGGRLGTTLPRDFKSASGSRSKN